MATLATWRRRDGYSDLTIDGSGNYQGVISRDMFAGGGEYVMSTPTGGYPMPAYPQPQSKNIALEIIITGGTYTTGQAALAEAFERGRRGYLIDDGNLALDCVVVDTAQQQGVHADGPNMFTAFLRTEDPRWRDLDFTTTSGTISGSGAAVSVANDGTSAEDKARYVLTPEVAKAAADGQQSRYYINCINRVKTARAGRSVVVEFDHAALGSGGTGESQDDGDDVRVWKGGREIPRWPLTNALYDFNDDETRIIFPLDFQAGRSADLFSALAATRAAGRWLLGETSGNAADTSGNSNTGTVTLGSGTQNASGLYRGSNGCVDFDSATTNFDCGSDTTLDDLFDGGGALFFVMEPDSDGEGSTGHIATKGTGAGAGWAVFVAAESGGFVRLTFQVAHATTDGVWVSALDVPINEPTGWCIVYDDDATTNDPTIYRYDFDEWGRVERVRKLTVGNGLTENATPAGAYETDATSNFIIGAQTAAGAATFDGKIDTVVALSSTPSAAAIAAYPFAEGDLEVEAGGTDGWPNRGLIQHPTTNEVIAYDGIAASNENGREAFLNIRRAVNGSSLASASASDTVWWQEHEDLQLLFGWTGATTPDQPTGQKTLMDLSAALSNSNLVWADFADSAYPNRPDSWSFRRRSDDTQADRIIFTYASPTPSILFEYQTDGAQPGQPNWNEAYILLPEGTAGSGTFTVTRALSNTVALLAKGRDLDSGQESTIATYSGPLTSGSGNFTLPANPLDRIGLYCRSQVIASTPQANVTATDTSTTITDISASDTDSCLFQKVILGTGSGGPFDITGVLVYVEAQTADISGSAVIYADDSGSPKTPLAYLSEIDSISLLTASGEHWYTGFTYSNNPQVESGQTVHVGLGKTSGSGTGKWFASRAAWEGVIPAYKLKILSTTAPFRDDASADDGDTASADAITIPLDTSTSVLVSLGAQESIVQLKDVEVEVRRAGISWGKATINAVARLGDELEIDVENGTAENLTTQENIREGVRFEDRSWLRLPPTDGSNQPQVRVTEQGMATNGYTMAVKWRARFD